MIRSVRASSIRRWNSTIISRSSRHRQPQKVQQHARKQLSSNSKNKPEEVGSYSNPNMDPHQVSDSMIRNSRTEIRTSGTEVINNEIPPETHMKNYALALGLVGFVSGVWYYSIQAVGNAGGGMDALMADAESAKQEKLIKSHGERSVEELAQLDVTMSEMEDSDDLVVAVAADDEIAQKEEDLNMAAGKKGKTGRPLWKKIVFFWKRE